MDPFSAISLVASIIAFVDFGTELISAAREISITGMTKTNAQIEFLSTNMEALLIDLETRKPASAMSVDELRLSKLAEECQGISQDLRKLLDKIRARDPKSKRQRFASIVKDVWMKNEKQDLEDRLDKCRQQLHLQLSQSSRFVGMSGISFIISCPAWVSSQARHARGVVESCRTCM